MGEEVKIEGNCSRVAIIVLIFVFLHSNCVFKCERIKGTWAFWFKENPSRDETNEEKGFNVWRVPRE